MESAPGFINPGLMERGGSRQPQKCWKRCSLDHKNSPSVHWIRCDEDFGSLFVRLKTTKQANRGQFDSLGQINTESEKNRYFSVEEISILFVVVARAENCGCNNGEGLSPQKGGGARRRWPNRLPTKVQTSTPSHSTSRPGRHCDDGGVRGGGGPERITNP